MLWAGIVLRQPSRVWASGAGPRRASVTVVHPNPRDRPPHSTRSLPRLFSMGVIDRPSSASTPRVCRYSVMTYPCSHPRLQLDHEEVRKMKVHLDTDLGGDIDDLYALALLLRWPDVEITGVTTVIDDGGRRAGYVRYALAAAGRRDIPVAAGADWSCGRFRFAADLPSEAAYWPEPVAPAPGLLSDAIGLLRRSIEAGARVVAIGPYTNLALLDEAHPWTACPRRTLPYGRPPAPHSDWLPTMGQHHGFQRPIRRHLSTLPIGAV